MTEEEILAALLEKYADDEDAIETIKRTEQELPYLRSRREGQTPMQHIMSLVGFLETWH